MLAAQQGLEERLGRIEGYCRKAAEVAEALRALPQIAILPDPPVTNLMHLFIRGEAARLVAAAVALARETHVRLFRRFAPTEIPGYQRAEFTAGDATLDLANDEIVALFQSLLRRAEA